MLDYLIYSSADSRMKSKQCGLHKWFDSSKRALSTASVRMQKASWIAGIFNISTKPTRLCSLSLPSEESNSISLTWLIMEIAYLVNMLFILRVVSSIYRVSYIGISCQLLTMVILAPTEDWCFKLYFVYPKYSICIERELLNIYEHIEWINDSLHNDELCCIYAAHNSHISFSCLA